MSWTPPRYPLIVNSQKIMESYLLTLILAILLPFRLRKPSDFLITLLFLNPILPTFALYGLADRARNYTYMVAIAFMLILLIQRKMPTLKIPSVRQGLTLALGVSILGAVSGFMFLVSKVGFHHLTRYGHLYLLLNIEAVLTIRKIFREVVRGGFQGYLTIWTYNVFIPFLILYVLYKKRYVFLIFLLIAEILIAMLTAHKGILASICLILGSYIIVERRSALNLMIFGFLVVVAGTTLLALTGGPLLPSALISERFLFTHARLNYAYYEFFSKAGFVYLSSTSLPVPIDYPFEFMPERLVGKYIFLSDTIASAGFLATSYMHFGFVGMVLFAVIVGVLLRLLDSLIIEHVPLRVGVPLAITPFVTLFTSSDLTTALVTYGILPTMFLLWLLRKRKIQKEGL